MVDIDASGTGSQPGERYLMSDISDFATELAKKVHAKQRTQDVADEAQLQRAKAHDIKLRDLWKQFAALVREGIDTFNAHVPERATFHTDTPNEVRVDLGGQRIFVARLEEGLATKIVFYASEAASAPREWYTIALNQRQDVVITDERRLAVTGPEELAKRALTFMFAPFGA